MESRSLDQAIWQRISGVFDNIANQNENNALNSDSIFKKKKKKSEFN